MENKVNEAAAMAQNNETENAAANTAAAIVEPTAAETPKAEPGKDAKKPGKDAKKGKGRKEAREEMEEKQLEALERQREIEAKQKELQNCLKELDRKKKLSENRSKFIETLDRLEEAEGLINPEDFETKRMKLTLSELSESGYSRDGFSTSISNSGLILEFIAMLKEKVTLKIEELETELVK